MEHILAITGSASPIGAFVAREVAHQQGHRILSVGRASSSSQVDEIGDISSPKTASALFTHSQPHSIIHLSHSPLSEFDGDVKKYKFHNLEFAKLLAYRALEVGCGTFIFGSSSAVYGDHIQGEIPETSSFNPNSAYGELKAEIEDELERIFEGTKIRHVSLRMFNVYGPGLSNSIISKLMSKSPAMPLKIYGPDNFIRDYVHVADVAAVFNKTLKTEKPLPKSLNLGTGIATSNLDLLDLVEPSLSTTIEIVKSEFSSSIAHTALLSETLGPVEFLPLSQGLLTIF